MASEIRTFACTVPITATIAAPSTFSLAMPARIVDWVRFRVPPGPRGSVGFMLASGGQVILPENAGGWLVEDDTVIQWELENQLQSGAWQLLAYNLGAYPHTIYVTFGVDPPYLVTPAPLIVSAPLPAALLGGVQ